MRILVALLCLAIYAATPLDLRTQLALAAATFVIAIIVGRAAAAAPDGSTVGGSGRGTDPRVDRTASGRDERDQSAADEVAHGGGLPLPTMFIRSERGEQRARRPCAASSASGPAGAPLSFQGIRPQFPASVARH